MGKANKFSTEVRERAIRFVDEQTKEHASQWATRRSVPSLARSASRRKPCEAGSVKPSETGGTGAVWRPTDERAHFKQLQREVRELRRTNEILKYSEPDCQDTIRRNYRWNPSLVSACHRYEVGGFREGSVQNLR